MTPTVNFISVQFFKDRFTTTVSSDEIERAISSAMLMHIMPVLGSSLYHDLCDKIRTGTLTGATDLALMRDHVQPMCREYTYYELIGQKAFRLEDTGAYVNAPDGLKPLEVADIKYFRREALNTAQMLAESTKRYLCDNSSLYPAYQSSNQVTPPSNEGDDWFIGIS